MNKNKLFLSILLGVMVFELSAKPKYRIQSWVYLGATYYLPERKVKIRIRNLELPIRIWTPGAYPYTNKQAAEEIINNWKYDEKAKKEWKQSIYTEIK